MGIIAPLFKLSISAFFEKVKIKFHLETLKVHSDNNNIQCLKNHRKCLMIIFATRTAEIVLVDSKHDFWRENSNIFLLEKRSQC